MFIPASDNYFGICDNVFLPNCPKPSRHAASVWINDADRDNIPASTSETAAMTDTTAAAIGNFAKQLRKQGLACFSAIFKPAAQTRYF